MTMATARSDRRLRYGRLMVTSHCVPQAGVLVEGHVPPTVETFLRRCMGRLEQGCREAFFLKFHKRKLTGLGDAAVPGDPCLAAVGNHHHLATDRTVSLPTPTSTARHSGTLASTTRA